MIKEERATSIERVVMNKLVELINDSLYATNLISDCIPGKLPKVKEIKKQWKQDLANKDQQINAIKGITWHAL